MESGLVTDLRKFELVGEKVGNSLKTIVKYDTYTGGCALTGFRPIEGFGHGRLT
jgi:hypothetical protein